MAESAKEKEDASYNIRVAKMILKTLKEKIWGFLDEHILFFGVLMLFLTLVWVVVSPTDRLFEKKKQVMITPADYRKHLDLAEGYLEINNYREAKREFDLAVSLKEAFLANNKGQDVLGEESFLGKIKERILEPEEIKEEIEKWQGFVGGKPDYRDGYLKLAVLYWRLGEEVRAKENLQKALEIDPNYDLALEFKGIIR